MYGKRNTASRLTLMLIGTALIGTASVTMGGCELSCDTGDASDEVRDVVDEIGDEVEDVADEVKD